MSIFDVQHQARAHRIIQRALASRRMPHAYLFAGPEGTGRELMAMRLGAILLCTSPVRVPLPADVAVQDRAEGTDACGQCDDCRLVHAGTHPDLFVIYRQLNREHPDSTIRKQKALVLGVDVVRHFLIDRVPRRPMRGRAKLFIVREAERLNDAAQNSLLKTLEEPPPDTFLILLTTATDRMLPTTRSRCQPVAFQPLPAGFVAERLGVLRPDITPQERDFVARQSGGSLGIASRLIEDGLFAIKRAWGDRLIEFCQPPRGYAPQILAAALINDARTIGKQAAERDPDISETDASRIGVQAVLSTLAAFYQDAQRLATGTGLEPVNSDQTRPAELIASTHTPARIVSALQQIALADSAVGRNAGLELAMETMFTQLFAVSQGRPGLRLAP